MIVRRGLVELHVHDHGPRDAPPVLLIHGYPDTHDVWSLVTPRLLDAGLRVITYDVRGAGASSRPPRDAAYTLAHLADDAAAVIDALSPDRPVHVVGHDWGSVQAWELVSADHAASASASTVVSRRRVASFTSISGPCLDHVGHWLQRQRMPPIGQALRSIYVAALHVPRAVEAVWPRLAPRWAALRSSTERADAGPASPTLIADAVQGAALYRANVGPRLRQPNERRVRVPVQLIVPLRDRYVSRELAIEAARPWVDDLRVRELDAGHWCPRTAPEPVARAIVEHVSEKRTSADRSPRTGRTAGESEIRPRRIAFPLEGVERAWVPGDRFVGHVIDVLHLLLPAGERWFVDVYREALPLVTDARLRADMKGFMGQEATHARAHDDVLAWLRGRGVETRPFTARVEWMFERVFGKDAPPGMSARAWLELRLGGIAAVEHFTCVLGVWIVGRSGALDAAGADPRMMALLRWHGAEELEHRRVAFDTLVHVAGRRAYLWRAVGLALAAPIMTLLWERGTRFFAQGDASYLDFARAVWARRVPGVELVAAVPRFLAPGYHPRHEADDEVARAYLRYAAAR